MQHGAEFDVIAEISRRMKQQKVTQFGNSADEEDCDLMGFVAGVRNGEQLFVVYHGPGPLASSHCLYTSAIFLRCDEFFTVNDARYKHIQEDDLGEYPAGSLGERWARGERAGIQETLVIARYPLLGPPTIAHYDYTRTGTKIVWTRIHKLDPNHEVGAMHDAIRQGFAKRREIQPEIDAMIEGIQKNMKKEGFTPEEREYWTDRGMAKFLSNQKNVYLVQYLGEPQVIFKDGKETSEFDWQEEDK